MDGTDFLCMVSPSERLALPSVREIVEGTRVCPDCGPYRRYRAEDREGLVGTGVAMALAGRNIDWERQFATALYGDVARKIHERDGDMATCSQCAGASLRREDGKGPLLQGQDANSQ